MKLQATQQYDTDELMLQKCWTPKYSAKPTIADCEELPLDF